MHPDEVWWLVEAKKPPKSFGSLIEPELETLVDDMRELGVLNG